MTRAKLPNLEAWADGALTLAVETEKGTFEVLHSTADAPEPPHCLPDAISQSLSKLIGVDVSGSVNGSTLLSIYHRGRKVAAVCEHTGTPPTPEAIREVAAALLFEARDVKRPEPPHLDPKEIAYLKKVAEGLPDAEIAESLNLSLRAVKERKKRTLVDLDAVSIAHAVAIATASRQI